MWRRVARRQTADDSVDVLSLSLNEENIQLIRQSLRVGCSHWHCYWPRCDIISVDSSGLTYTRKRYQSSMSWLKYSLSTAIR